MIKYLLFVVLHMSAFSSYASESVLGDSKWLFEMSGSYGGDSLGTILFYGGEDQSIKAGQGLAFSTGFQQELKDSDFGIKALIGYKFSSSMASNADVWKTVTPLDIIPYYRINKNSRIGLGVTLHLNPQIDWDWLAPSEKFDDASGLVFEYSYSAFSFGYTSISYTSINRDVDASHFFIKVNNSF
ncbi:MAG: hypothetical protein OQK98_03955 [Gammaproteobacteria bacterium]|nr:hypothetical protein [Gammaproteobacteria bacterium]